MAQIIPDGVSLFYSPFLALPAPKIAGLLPAHAGQASQAPTGTSAAKFTYRNAALARLSAERCAQLIDSVTMLLDVAVAYANSEMNDNALRAAQVLFHRQLTGHSPDGPGRHNGRPIHPTAYRAERDADMLEWLVSAKKRLGEVRS